MKQSYHTDFAIQFKLNLLEKEDYQNIPKSTLYSWKTKDFSRLIGTDIVFSDENLKLLKPFCLIIRFSKLLKAYIIFILFGLRLLKMLVESKRFYGETRDGLLKPSILLFH